MLSSVQARMMRTAISARLDARTFLNGGVRVRQELSPDDGTTEHSFSNSAALADISDSTAIRSADAATRGAAAACGWANGRRRPPGVACSASVGAQSATASIERGIQMSVGQRSPGW